MTNFKKLQFRIRNLEQDREIQYNLSGQEMFDTYFCDTCFWLALPNFDIWYMAYGVYMCTYGMYMCTVIQRVQVN